MEKDNIESVVFNYFVRAMKDDGKYMLFRRGVQNDGLMKILLRNHNRLHPIPDTPFSCASSVKDVVDTLAKITNDIAKNNGNKNGAEDLDRYEHVTMAINHLLHFFLEINGVPINKLSSLGEEIYNNSCHKLFGDTLDDLKLVEEDKKAQGHIDSIKNGENDKKMTFDEFIKKHKENVFNSINKTSSISNEFIRVFNDDWVSHNWDVNWRDTSGT